MAEAARRHQQVGGDLVRRLIARPVRLEQQVRTRVESRVEVRPGVPVGAPVSEPDDADEAARLQAEMQVMKAVLRAQRRELESLRAQRQVLTESATDEDARATRVRWASLVDSLLIRAR